uniref:Uncharacterized protein n=1 Tax=Arundo donax TaxID=35708 RepID=A0A0A9G7K2_ARUDO
MKLNWYYIDIYLVHLWSLTSLHKSTKKEALIVPSCQSKGKMGSKNGMRWLAKKRKSH